MSAADVAVSQPSILAKSPSAGRSITFRIAYVESLDRFDRMLRRMAGLEDGIPDALFKFSRAVTGGYYWCPPIEAGRLILSYLGM